MICSETKIHFPPKIGLSAFKVMVFIFRFCFFFRKRSLRTMQYNRIFVLPSPRSWNLFPSCYGWNCFLRDQLALVTISDVMPKVKKYSIRCQCPSQILLTVLFPPKIMLRGFRCSWLCITKYFRKMDLNKIFTAFTNQVFWANHD